jgi:hypothetical protein
MKALLVVGLLLGVGFPVNEATGQTAACRKALAAYKGANEAFIHATVALGPAGLVPTCTALDALFDARKRKDATQKGVRSACPPVRYGQTTLASGKNSLGSRRRALRNARCR